MPAFVVPERPKSVNKGKTADWEGLVSTHARNAWAGQPIFKDGALHVTIIFLYHERPIDVDNIVKPILDALKGVSYVDDSLVTDLDSHRRSLDETFDVTRMPAELIAYLGGASEVVYISVRLATHLEDYLE